ncbi:Cytochrome P450 4C1 like protein [Argiope bruennichi]|uniref:Cytochrome P450 4C1 like protein n=1 Tax=Argiope bruennichi TaxID=94029 RepID=A0A8T0EE16_ARGBR|nr:Cytochrome P450 4C1 like protein [Argiope bruennichi]
MNFQIGGNCDYSNALHEIEGAVMYRALRPWLYPDIIFNLTTVGKKFKSNVRLFRGFSKKETLRLYPVIPVITRVNDQEFKVCQKFAMMEAKTILACILAHFRVKSLDTQDKVLFYPNITLRNVYPMRLSFELR